MASRKCRKGKRKHKQPATCQSITFHTVKIPQLSQETCTLRNGKCNFSGTVEMVPGGKWNFYRLKGDRMVSTWANRKDFQLLVLKLL